jgi:hypothetical protein
MSGCSASAKRIEASATYRVTAATLVAGVAAFGSDPSADGRTADSPARQVLLMAATRSAAAPATGRYLRISTETATPVTLGSRKHPYEMLHHAGRLSTSVVLVHADFTDIAPTPTKN